MDKDTRQSGGLSRRAFMGTMGLGMGGCLLGLASLKSAYAEGEAAGAGTAQTGKKAILYDASKCVGCHYCEGGCKNANGLPAEVVYDIKALPEDVLPKLMIPAEMVGKLNSVGPVTADDRDAGRWLRVTQKSVSAGDGEAESVFVRHSCTHCGLCAQACPAGALKQRDDGIVTVEPERCIGCFYCYQACPFDIPRYRDEVGDKAMRKCAMCVNLIDQGQTPACVNVCPLGALTYGDPEEMKRVGQEAVADLIAAGYPDAYLYGAEELGGIGVMSVLAHAPATYGIPALPV